MIRRCLVTGAGGFLGSYAVRALLEQEITVAVLLRGREMPERLRGVEQKLTVIRGDLADADGWQPSLMRFSPDAVLHLAWQGVEGGARNDPSQAGNVPVALNLTAAAKACGARHFIGAGSQAEYGPLNRLCHESDPAEPTTLYGHAKLEACRKLEAFCNREGLRFAWLRVFSTYGPGDHEHWMIPYVIEELLAGRAPKLTRCEQRWDYLHARDAAAAFASVLTEERAAGTFNLGSGEAPPLADIVKILRDLINPSLPLDIGAIPYKPDQVMHLQADISRLTSTTGWKPRISLPEGLRETVAWYAARYKK